MTNDDGKSGSWRSKCYKLKNSIKLISKLNVLCNLNEILWLWLILMENNEIKDRGNERGLLHFDKI
jgi:hypothetical protein